MRVLLLPGRTQDADAVRRALLATHPDSQVETSAPEAAASWLAAHADCDAVVIDGSHLVDSGASGLLQTLREQRPGVPIVAVVAADDPTGEAQAVLAGADAAVSTGEGGMSGLGALLLRLRRRQAEAEQRRTWRLWFAGRDTDLRRQVAHQFGSRVLLMSLSADGRLVPTIEDPSMATALVVDARDKPGDALAGLQKVREAHPALAVVVVAEERHHVAFLRAGFEDCVPPGTDGERLLIAIERVLAARQVSTDVVALRARENRLRALVEYLPDAVVLVSAARTVLAINLAGLELLGAEEARHVIGRSLAGWLTPAPEGDLDRFVDTVSAGKPEEMRVETRHASAPKPVMLRAVPFQREVGKPASVLIVLRELLADETAIVDRPSADATAMPGADELEQLREQLATASQALAEATSAERSATQRVVELQADLTASIDIDRQHLARLAELERELSDLRANVEQPGTRREDVEASTSALEQTLAQEQARAAGLGDDLREARQALEQFEQRAREIEAERDARAQQVRDLQQALDAAVSEFDAQRTALTSSGAQAREQLAAVEQQAREALAAAEQQARELEAQRDAHAQQVRDLQQALDAATSDNEAQRTALTSSGAQAREQLAAAEQQAREALAAAEQQARELEAERDARTQQVSHLQQALDAATSDNEAQRAALSSTDAQAREQLAAAEQQAREALAAAEQRAREIEAERDSRAQQVRDLQQALDAATSENEAQRAALSSTDAQAREQLAAAEQQAREALAAAEQQARELEAQRDAHAQQVGHLQQALDAATSENEAQRAALSSTDAQAREQLAAAQGTAQDALARLQALEQQQHESSIQAQATVTALEGALADEQARAGAVAEQLREARETSSRLEQRLHEFEAARAADSETITALRAALAAAQADADRHQSALTTTDAETRERVDAAEQRTREALARSAALEQAQRDAESHAQAVATALQQALADERARGAALSEQLREAREAVSQLEQRAHQRDEERTAREAAADELERQGAAALEVLRARETALLSETATARDRVQDAEAARAAAERQVEDLSSRLSFVEQQRLDRVRALEQEREALTREVAQLQTLREELPALRAAQRQVVALEGQLVETQQVRAQALALETEVSELRDTRDKARQLEVALERARAELDAVQQIPAKLEAAVDEETRWLLYEVASIGHLTTTLEGRILGANDIAARLLGHFSRDALQASGRLPEPLLLAAGAFAHRPTRFEVCLQHGDDGPLHWIVGLATPHAGVPASVTWMLIDVSEQRLQARRSRFLRRMEAMTHVLSAATAESTTLMERAAPLLQAAVSSTAPGSDEEVEATRTALARTQALLAQLSGFARKRARRAGVRDIRTTLEEAAPVLVHVAGEDIVCTIETHDTPLHATLEPSDFEQFLTALTMSGRDALPLGGRLTLATDALNTDARDEGAFFTRPSIELRLVAEGYGAVLPESVGALQDAAARLGASFATDFDSAGQVRMTVRMPRVFVIQ